MHKVDVLLPVFNNEATIESAVRSILDQTFRDFRLIIIDDGSTDRTNDIITRFAKGDDRLIVIRKENSGIVDALNLGLNHCRAELIARHDGDDIAFPERLKTQIDYLADHADCIAVSSNVWHIDENGARIGATHGHGDAIGNPEAIPAGEPHLIHPFLMARLSFIQSVQGYRHVIHAEDADLYFRLEPLGRLHVLEERLGEYRIHTGSITSSSVHNVRLGAVYSQMAALSARRKRAGSADITFSREFAERMKRASTLAEMLEVAARELTEQEEAYLQVASAAKMLQLRIYRRFRFRLADLRVIAMAIVRHRSLIPARDMKILLQTPFWYFYRPRAALNRMKRFFKRANP